MDPRPVGTTELVPGIGLVRMQAETGCERDNQDEKTRRHHLFLTVFPRISSKKLFLNRIYPCSSPSRIFRAKAEKRAEPF